jgi:chloride channel 7
VKFFFTVHAHDAQVRQVVETLRCCSHQAFPVTPDVKKAFDSAEPFELHGTILRHTVLHLLRHRIGFFDPAHAEIPPSRSHIPSTQAVSHGPSPQ